MSTFDSIVSAGRRAYRRFFAPPDDQQARAVVATLRQVEVFQELPRAVLRELAEAVHVRRYPPDEPIYYEGDPGLGLYVVQRGRVRLVTEDEDGVLHELQHVGEHEVFGELSILGDFRRMETAQALTETHALGFFRPDLRTLTKRHPKAGAAITAALARHCAERQVALLQHVAAREGRIAALRMLEGLGPAGARAATAPGAPAQTPPGR